MSELKPCPFCGGRARLSFGAFFYGYAEVWCTSCGARTKEIHSRGTATYAKMQAVEQWNRRATDSTKESTYDKLSPEVQKYVDEAVNRLLGNYEE